MNIFYLDEHPVKAAQMHHDKHVCKMIIETAQLLSTAHRVLDGIEFIDNSSGRKIKRWALADSKKDKVLYKATHINHPSAVWARESFENYVWLYDHFIALCHEYTYRYGKVHATYTKLADLLEDVPNKMLKDSFPFDSTEIPQAMPDYCKDKDPVVGYRTYYILEKKNQSKYTKRNIPEWL